MKCNRCGAEIKDEDMFCSECGKRLEKKKSKDINNNDKENVPFQKNPKFEGIFKKSKTTNIVMIVLTTLLVVCGVGGGILLSSNSARAFDKRLNSFQTYCEDYQLGDLEDKYLMILKEADLAVKYKDKDTYKEMERKFIAFETEVATYEAEVKKLVDKSEVYQFSYEKVLLSDSQEKTFDELKNELEEGLNTHSLTQIQSISEKLDSLYSECVNDNLQIIDEKRAEIESFSLGNLMDIEYDLLNEYEQNAKSYLSDDNYIESINEYQKKVSLLNNIKKSDGYDFTVEQIDTSSFPNIKLYVSAKELQTGVNIDLIANNLNIRELILDTYSKVTINKVSQLNEKEQLNTCLVADISGSMYGEMDTVKNVLMNFANHIQYDIGDKASLITFDNIVNIDTDFTNNKSALVNSISNMYIGNCTALYDALYVAICKTSMQNGAKCVIAFTDGYDNASTKSALDVVRTAQQYEIPVYIIGIGSYVNNIELQEISNQTGGFYRNIYDGNSMTEIYNSIYQENKQLYLVEYTTGLSDITVSQNLYLTYEESNFFMRCSSLFQPSKLQASEKEYTALIQNIGLSNADIENEVLRIRSVYNEIVEKRTNNQYNVTDVANGIKSYSENGDVRCIIIEKGIDNLNYSRYYYYEGGKLIFSYIEASDSHRLYFKNDMMFRWRYASDAVKFSEADNHDNEDSSEFRKWEANALDEAYRYN